MSRFFNYSKSGFTMIEVMLAIALVAICVPTIGYIIGLAVREEADNTQHTQAVFLAQSMMDEISQRRFKEDAGNPGNSADTGEISGSDRRGFDDIDDYDTFEKTWGPQSPPLDESGTALSNYSAFTQSVDIYNVLPPTSGPVARSSFVAQADGSTSFKVAQVTMSWDSDRRSVTLYKIFAQH